MRKLDIITPGSIEELFDVLERKDTKILAGGTDIIVDIKKGKCKYNSLIDISYIEGFNGIEKQGENIHIGDLTTFSDLISSQIIKEELIPLYEAAHSVGSLQIRNIATIGGNIVNRASAADGVNALLVLDAKLSFLENNGKNKIISMKEFLKEGITNKEVLEKIIIKPMEDGYKGAFTKVGNRKRVTISQIILSGICKVEDKKILDLKLALGAVGPYSFIVEDISKWSKGQIIKKDFQDRLGEQLSVVIEKSIPNRLSMPYKKIAIKGLLDNIYSRLFE